jgi:hypothetical protein
MPNRPPLIVSGGGITMTLIKNLATAIEKAGGGEREFAMLGKASVVPLIEEFAQKLVKLSDSQISSFEDLIQLCRFTRQEIASSPINQIGGERFKERMLEIGCTTSRVESKTTAGELYEKYKNHLADPTQFLNFIRQLAPPRPWPIGGDEPTATYLTLWRDPGDLEYGTPSTLWRAKVLENTTSRSLEMCPVTTQAIVWPYSNIVLSPFGAPVNTP